jgi:hypothetical protein
MRREKGVVARCEQLERGAEAMGKNIAARYSEADDSVARVSKDVRKACSKVDELASQVIANKAQVFV